jgi:hypothetical protein
VLGASLFLVRGEATECRREEFDGELRLDATKADVVPDYPY